MEIERTFNRERCEQHAREIIEQGARQGNNGSNIVDAPQIEDNNNAWEPSLIRNPHYQYERGQRRTMRECLMRSNICYDQSPMVHPTIIVNNFKIKPSMNQMI